MTRHTSGPLATLAAAVLLLAAAVSPAHAAAAAKAPARFVAEARALMIALGPESRIAAARIREVYGELDAHHVLRDREALAASLRAGGVAPFPLDNNWFNVRPRLTGRSPIGEKDLPHQLLYVAARPATLGLLLRIATRVRTPLDVTSLVRHQGYQEALARTNANARTTVPTHALGVAFDLSILNIPPGAARELRDVLRAMRDEGDLYFIAEVNQLVFHVVLAPQRAPFYAAVFEALRRVPAPAWAAPPAYPRWSSRTATPPSLQATTLEQTLAAVHAAAAPPPAYAATSLTMLLAFAASRRLSRRASDGPLRPLAAKRSHRRTRPARVIPGGEA
jgi:hypothetical protein